MPPSSATRWKPGAATPRSWRSPAPTRRSGSSCPTTSWWRCSTWAITPSTSTRSSSASSAESCWARATPVARSSVEPIKDAPLEWRAPSSLLLDLGHDLLLGLIEEPLALAADGVLLGRLPGRGEVVHQRMDHIVVAGLLEVGQDDVAGIGLGSLARLAHQARRPQAQKLVLAGARLELKFHVVLELLFKGLFAFVERRHFHPLRFGLVARGYSGDFPVFPPHPGSGRVAGQSEETPGCHWKSCVIGSAERRPSRILPPPSRCARSPPRSTRRIPIPETAIRCRRSGTGSISWMPRHNPRSALMAMPSAAISCRPYHCPGACGPAAASPSRASRSRSARRSGAPRRSSQSNPRAARPDRWCSSRWSTPCR